MQTFPVGTDASILLPFLDNDGNPVTPTALAYVVTDGQGTQVTAGSITELTGTDTTVTVPNNLLAVGGYLVQLTITVGTATYVQEEIFGVTPVVRLQFLVNSFHASRASAAFTARDIPNLISWLGASNDDQETALVEAFRRITKLNFFIPWPEIMDLQNRIAPKYQAHITPLMWPLMTPELFAVYPQYFKDALLKAQVIEANAILTSDPYADRRRSGLFSEKVGESSIMFTNGIKQLVDTCSRDTMNMLVQFLNTRYTLTRS